MSAQRRPDRRERRQIATRRAIGILFILFIAIGAVGYFYLSARKDIRPIDNVTLCPTDSKGPNSITAILIDRTDAFNPTQQAAIRDRLNEIKDQTSQYDLIEIYSVESTQKKLLKPEFSMCNPGRGEAISKWTGNPHLIEEHWQTLFVAPLQHLFDTILTGETAAISPIMESIQSIVVTKLGSQDLVSKKIPRRLIIVSDLLQYVDDYSQYRPLTTFKQFKTLSYYQGVRSDLSGISVEIWYIRRQKTLALQGKRHIDFWRDYLTDQGATIDNVWYVPGT
jgi:hypothetical protein